MLLILLLLYFANLSSKMCCRKSRCGLWETIAYPCSNSAVTVTCAFEHNFPVCGPVTCAINTFHVLLRCLHHLILNTCKVLQNLLMYVVFFVMFYAFLMLPRLFIYLCNNYTYLHKVVFTYYPTCNYLTAILPTIYFSYPFVFCSGMRSEEWG